MNHLDQFETRLRRIQERGGTTVTLSIREAELLLAAMREQVRNAPPPGEAIEIELRGEPF